MLETEGVVRESEHPTQDWPSWGCLGQVREKCALLGAEEARGGSNVAESCMPPGHQCEDLGFSFEWWRTQLSMQG